MGLNETPSGERVHIGFFGLRNAGKSSLVNAVTGQSLSVVSAVKGTTTDPVRKAMELLPLGPVLIIDTPGLDDEGTLGALRVEKARQALSETDIAVLVVDAVRGLSEADRSLLALLDERKTPYLIVYNKADLLTERPKTEENALFVSTMTGEGIHALKERLGALGEKSERERHLVADLLTPGDTVVLVVPIDESAPKGRLILPQQMVIRDILDVRCSAVVCQASDLKRTLAGLSVKPKLVITDSQVFDRVAKEVPKDVLLTSFSILMARYKGELETLIAGAAMLSTLRDGDTVLISEGCTHHRQCGDIGTVKLPRWISDFTGKDLQYRFTSGREFPEKPEEYALIVHCGGCMLNETEMRSRIAAAKAAGVPIVNYGLAIARIHGILQRSLEVFPKMAALPE